MLYRYVFNVSFYVLKDVYLYMIVFLKNLVYFVVWNQKKNQKW